MGLHLCHSSPFDFRDPCIRGSWCAIVPIALVTVFCVVYYCRLPSTPRGPSIVRGAIDTIKSPLKPYITLPEAEALDVAEDVGVVEEYLSVSASALPPLWRTVVFSWIALLEALVWLSIGSFRLVIEPKDVWYGLRVGLSKP